jgi:hypothetical protein
VFLVGNPGKKEFNVMDATETQSTETAEDKTSQTTEQQPAAETQDNLSDEARLAQEALAATEEPAGDTPEIESLKAENERLLGSITARRRLNRELDQKIAEKMAAEKAAQPTEKSPAEKYIDEHSDTFDPETEPFPAKVEIAQRKWEREQADKARKIDEQNATNQRANASYQKARQRFSDFDSILEEYSDVLTEGDKLDFANAAKKGDDVAELIYSRCIYKTLMAGGDRAKELRAKLKSKPGVSKASVQNQQKPTDGSQQKSGTEQKFDEQTTPAKAEENLNPQQAMVYAAFGVDE